MESGSGLEIRSGALFSLGSRWFWFRFSSPWPTKHPPKFRKWISKKKNRDTALETMADIAANAAEYRRQLQGLQEQQQQQQQQPLPAPRGRPRDTNEMRLLKAFADTFIKIQEAQQKQQQQQQQQQDQQAEIEVLEPTPPPRRRGRRPKNQDVAINIEQAEDAPNQIQVEADFHAVDVVDPSDYALPDDSDEQDEGCCLSLS